MDAFLPLPSFAFAVIVTVFPFPVILVVTTPLELTEAYLLLLLLQATFLLEAFDGETDAFNVIFFPVRSVLEDPVMATLLTFTLEEDGVVVEEPERFTDARVVTDTDFVPVFVSGVQLPFPNIT